MTRRQQEHPESRTARTLYATVGTVLGVLFVAPLVWAVLRSFESETAITSAPKIADFTHLTITNYQQLVGGSIQILHYVGNSLLGLVLFYSTFNLPFGVFVMRNTFSQVPAELEESARVDGAGTFTTLWRVMRPLVAPGIATTVLYAFLFAWTEFLAALTFLTQQGTYTFPVALLNFPVALLNVETGTFGAVNYGYLVAGAVIAMVPCVVLYLALQRYYVQGLMSGAVKG